MPYEREVEMPIGDGSVRVRFSHSGRPIERYSVVLVALVDGVWEARKEDYAAASAALYVAVTRAQHRLIVPERLRHWLEEISGRSRAPRPQLSFER